MTGSGAKAEQLRATAAEQFAQAHAQLLSDDSIQFDLPGLCAAEAAGMAEAAVGRDLRGWRRT